MPFRSQAQWGWAFATGQEWADEWAKMTPGGKRKFLLLQKRVGASKAIESLKHLPGRHNQQAHGRSWANKISRRIDAERTKADDVTADGKPKRYSAGRGEVISGNLGRDDSGQFANIGNAMSLTQRIINRGSGPKKKRGGGSKLSLEQAQAKRDKIGKETITRLGFTGNEYDSLSKIGEEPISMEEADSEAVKKLIENNMAEVVGEVVSLTTLGKRVLKISQSGKPNAVKEVIARDSAKREAGNKKREASNQTRVDKYTEQIASYEDRISDKKMKPSTRAILKRKLAVARTRLEEISPKKKPFSLKNLPGKHNQASHGHDGGGGSSGISVGSGISDARPTSVNQAQIENYYNSVNAIIDSATMPQDARFAASSLISRMNEATQMALLNDPSLNGITFTSLATFGTPAVRDLVARKYYDVTRGKMYYGYDADNPEPYQTFNKNGEYIDNPYQFMHKHSLEFAEYRRGKGAGIDENKTAEFLWGVHAGDERGMTTAQLQMALTQVGPNADVPRSAIRSFYPVGIDAPTPQPRYVAALQETYRITQATLAQEGITSVKLHRGSDLTPGLALEPWTAIKGIASTFLKHYNQGKTKYESKAVIRSATIPAKYFLATWKTAEGWNEEGVRGKQEHMVAGLAYANDNGLLTTKAHTMKSSPVVDLMTYDIYFNYRLKPKKPATRTKAIAERRLAIALKHLPGKHDQSTHGRGGNGGGGVVVSSGPKAKPQTPSAVAGSADPKLMEYATKFAQETEALRRARLYDADGNYIATEEQRVAFHAELVKRGEKLANKLRKEFGLTDTPSQFGIDPEVDAKFDEVVRTALRQPTNAPISFVMNEFPELQQVLEARVAPYVHLAPPDRKPVAIVEVPFGPPTGGFYHSVDHGEVSGFNTINLYGKDHDVAAHEYGHYIECEKVGSTTTMYDFMVRRIGKQYVEEKLREARRLRDGGQDFISSASGKFPAMSSYAYKWYYGNSTNLRIEPGTITVRPYGARSPSINATEVVTTFLEKLTTPRYATRSVQFPKMFGYIYATLNY